jgi:hypothetical protein
MAGAAGTVIVALPDFWLFAIDVAVTVTVIAELVAAGAVKVAEVFVSLDSAPPPLTAHVTPSLFLSFCKVAVKVVLSFPSSLEAAAVTVTLIGFELPPQPERPVIIANASRSPHKGICVRSPDR